MAREGRRNEDDGETRIVVIWNAKGITVQSKATNPTVIAALEMAKSLMLQQTIGPGKRWDAGEAMFAQAPAVLGRKVDAPPS